MDRPKSLRIVDWQEFIATHQAEIEADPDEFIARRLIETVDAISVEILPNDA